MYLETFLKRLSKWEIQAKFQNKPPGKNKIYSELYFTRLIVNYFEPCCGFWGNLSPSKRLHLCPAQVRSSPAVSVINQSAIRVQVLTTSFQENTAQSSPYSTHCLAHSSTECVCLNCIGPACQFGPIARSPFQYVTWSTLSHVWPVFEIEWRQTWKREWLKRFFFQKMVMEIKQKFVYSFFSILGL